MRAGTGPTLEREGEHALLSTALSVLLGLALSIVVSRTLGPSGKGVLDVASTTIALFTLLLGSSLYPAVTHLAARSPALPAGLRLQLAAWGAGAAGATVLALGVRPDFAARIGLLPPGDPWFWTGFVAVSVGGGVWAATLRGVLVAHRGSIAANRIDLLVKAGLMAGYLALLVRWRTPEAFAIVGAAMAVALPLLLLSTLRGPTAKAPLAWGAFIAAALPVHATQLVHFLNQRADVFLLQAWHGSREVGLYALAVSLAQIVLLASSALAQPLLPRISSAVSADEANAATARSCRVYIALALLGSAILAAASSWLVPFAFGRDFSASLPSLLILLPGMIGFGLANLLISYFIGIDRQAVNLWIALAVLAVTIAGNFWLTRRLGALGAALTSLAAYGLAGGLAVLSFARVSRTPLLTALWPTRADWRHVLGLPQRLRL